MMTAYAQPRAALGRAGAAVRDRRAVLLETGPDQSVHLARISRSLESRFAVAAISGRRVARGTLPLVGSEHVGRTAAARSSPARRSVSAKLAAVPDAAASRLAARSGA